ncbi:OmpP1/FadL family transporter [Ferrimonas kyonanensis]|uniref:OmpP1/FadL family transporter n=1 Tax=Ferrimonas kyonanensis TaxID=364763 RepID=UPI00041896F6|nr:outer membrane protein transport protein [Ferrimonas kyonanensis]
MNRSSKYLSLGLVALSATLATTVNASGLLRDDTASAYLGSAGAGRAADISAGAAFNNPAGLAFIEQRQVEANLMAIDHHFNFKDQGSSGSNDGFDQRRRNVDYDVGVAAGNSLFYGQPLDENWGMGLALASPAGGAADFGSNWVGDNFIESVDVLVLTATASVGYRINQQWSLGASLGANYMSWELDMAPFPGASENLDLSSTEFTWSMGLMYRPDELTRLGLRYVAGVEHELTGDTTLISPMGTQKDQATHVFNLADLVTFSLDRQLGAGWTLLADLEWAQWSDLEESRIVHDHGPTIVIPRNWNDAWSAAIGFNYRLSQQWLLEAGIAYDQSVVSKADHKLDPPMDRQLAYAVGASWQVSERTRLDLNYQYLDLGDIEVNQAINGYDPIAEAPFQQQIRGQSEAHIHLLSLGLSHQF